MTKNERVRRVARLCCYCAVNVAYYRAWWDGKELITKDDFFVNANTNALDIAVLDWCILFTERRGKHDWRKVVPETGEFLPELYAQLKIDENCFEEHCLKMKTYRDKFLAHLDEDRFMDIPDLTITLNSVVFLFGILRSEYSEMLIDAPSDLRQFYRERLAHGKRHATVQRS